MAEKHIVVQGAICKCQYGQAPDTLKVLSHDKEYANDKDASKKRIATTKEIGGATLEKNTFGNCLKIGGNPPPPCKPVITEWKDFYNKVTLSNGGNILLEDSKAVCAIAGTPCIEIIDHGQRTEASAQNFKNTNKEIQRQINPLVTPEEMFEKQPYEDPLFVEVDDIIVLGNSAGASELGHQAVLIGSEEKGWTYISKDGAEKSGSGLGKSRYIVKTYKTLQEFADSVHNFETSVNHSLVGGGENPEASKNFALDSKGNKIRRYDRAFRIKTNDINDALAIKNAKNEAKTYYNIASQNCSHVVEKCFEKVKDISGYELKTEKWNTFTPNKKQSDIEERNTGTDVSSLLEPSSYSLKDGEKEKGK